MTPSRSQRALFVVATILACLVPTIAMVALVLVVI